MCVCALGLWLRRVCVVVCAACVLHESSFDRLSMHVNVREPGAFLFDLSLTIRASAYENAGERMCVSVCVLRM